MPTLSPPSELTNALNTGLTIAASKGARDVLISFRRIDPRTIAGDWPVIGKRISDTITKGQQSAQFLSSWYLAEAISTVTAAPAGLVDIPDLTGRTVSGMSIGQYVSRTPDVVAKRVADGMKPEDALDMSARRLVGMASSEPHRISRATVAYGAVNDERITGWQRIAEPNACDFCEMLATRGDAYTSKASAEQSSKDLAYHNNCRCYADVVFTSNAQSVNAAAARSWAAMEAPTIAGRARRAIGGPATIETIANLDSSIRLEQLIIAEKSRITGRTAAAQKRLASLQARREALIARNFAAPGAAAELEATLIAREQARLSALILEVKASLATAQARVAGGDVSASVAVKYGTRRLKELQQRLSAL